jgi:putative hemolysin
MASSFFSYADEQDPLFERIVINRIETLLGRRQVENIYNRWVAEVSGSGDHEAGRLLAMSGIDVSIQGHWPLENIPDGPILMVANHPFGFSDGIAMASIAERLGRPYKVIVNERMTRVPEFRPHNLPISFEKTREAIEMNMATRVAAIKLLRDGGTVGIFPGGSVATAPRGFGLAEELDWKMFMPKLALMGQANVLPIYFEGQNSLLFQLVSRFSLTARRALLICEFVRQRGRPIVARTGPLIPWREIAEIGDRKLLSDRVRSAVFAMCADDPRRARPAAMRSKQHHPLWQEDSAMMSDTIRTLRERSA